MKYLSDILFLIFLAVFGLLLWWAPAALTAEEIEWWEEVGYQRQDWRLSTDELVPVVSGHHRVMLEQTKLLDESPAGNEKKIEDDIYFLGGAPEPPPPPLSPEKQAREWIAEFFQPADIHNALQVAKYESSYDPQVDNKQGSDAAGLFQHRKRYWSERELKARSWWRDKTGEIMPVLNIYDGRHSSLVAAWLVYKGGGWSHFHSCYSGQQSFNKYARKLAGEGVEWAQRWIDAGGESTGGWISTC